MKRASGHEEKRRYPRFLADLPLEYREIDDPHGRGGVVVNASEAGLLIESVKNIRIGTKLNISVLFLKGFELADFRVAAEILWKEPYWKEDWEGYQYGLRIVKILKEDHWKLKFLLSNRLHDLGEIPDNNAKLKVVARYRNGRVLKGFVQSFSPDDDHFCVIPAQNPKSKAEIVLMKDLKALFMVRDFVGDPLYKERKKYVEGQKPSARILEITFMDGEVMIGTTLGFDPKRPGFFIIPADPKSNNTRVFVVSSGVKSIRPAICEGPKVTVLDLNLRRK